MHDARRLSELTKSKRLISALLMAGVMAGVLVTTTAVLYAMDDYNGNWLYCRTATPLDPYWWYYECWKPEPPGGAPGS